MALRLFQYLGIVLALGLLAGCTEHGGDSASSTEDALDSNYDLPSQADNEKEYAEDLSNDQNTEQVSLIKNNSNYNDRPYVVSSLLCFSNLFKTQLNKI